MGCEAESIFESNGSNEPEWQMIELVSRRILPQRSGVLCEVLLSGYVDSSNGQPAGYRLGRYRSVLVPKNTSADCITVSDNVGWGWIVSATSFASAAISIASVPSAMSSPAPGPTIPTPSTRSVAG